MNASSAKVQPSVPFGRHWIGVCNNPQPWNYASFLSQQNLFDYYVFANEVGEKGTPHIQSYFCLKTKKRETTVRKLFPGFHIELMGDTPATNIAYCKKGKQSKGEFKEQGVNGPNYGKEADFQEYGTPPLAQTQKATKVAKENYAETLRLARLGQFDSIDPHHQLRFYSTIQRYHRDQQAKLALSTLDWEDGKPPNQWFWGATGVGKSKRARDENPGAYLKMLNKWWDKYQYESVVIIEVFK